MKKVLILGNIPTNHPNSIGGATVLTNRIVKYLKKKDDISITFLCLRKRWKSKWQIIDYLFLLVKFPFIILKYDIISIHGSRDVHMTIGPFLVFYCKLFKKKVVYHFFGGNFHKDFENINEIFKKILLKTIFNSNNVLLETKEMIHFFSGKCKAKLVWFPNARKKQNNIKIKSFEKKFVFISQVTRSKGIDNLIKIVDKLPTDYVLDIYGPLGKEYSKIFFKDKNLNYCGILKPNEVLEKLKEYDVLVLPTLYSNEGYPGIIIEALSCGKPVIATDLNSIREVIDQYKEGILFDKNSEIQLMNAFIFFNDKNYSDFCLNSMKKFIKFDEEIVFSKLYECYLEL